MRISDWSSDVCSSDLALHAEATPEQSRMLGYGSYDLAVDVLEQAVSRHDYIAGDRFSAADVYVGSQVGWGVQFGTLPKRDAFTAYVGRLMASEAYARANEKDDALANEEASHGKVVLLRTQEPRVWNGC